MLSQSSWLCVKMQKTIYIFNGNTVSCAYLEVRVNNNKWRRFLGVVEHAAFSWIR